MDACEARQYAREDFGSVVLPDVRNVSRVMDMAAVAHLQPAGRVVQVFPTSAARQGAYDFLGNDRCSAEALTESLGNATALRAAKHDVVFVSVDGSSLSLTDRTGKKGFGRVGSTKQEGRGLKVVSSLAFDAAGVTLGVLDQQWWTRAARKKRHDCHARDLHDKETKYWVDSLDASKRRLTARAPRTRIWFLLDRENDRRHCLDWLRDSGATYVVRSSFNRRLEADGKRYLCDELEAVAPLHEYSLKVMAGPKRAARNARMVVRAFRVRLRIRDRSRGKKLPPLETTVVEAREERTTPPGEKPLVWRLLTNHLVTSSEEADEVIDAYAMRWRIEDFHKTWKTGACNVEDAQLRSKNAVVKWAIIMASVAARIERLKHLGRNEPELPASRELTKYEIRALIHFKRKYKKRTETIPDTEPTIGQAIIWIAELGGYTGKSSGGPPGSITIRRGLDYLAPAAAILESLELDREN